LRARWKALPVLTRAAIAIGLEVALAILFYALDNSLGYGVLTVAALYWLRRLPPLPWKLAGQIVLVALFAFTAPSLAVTLAIFFAVFWVPERYRVWLLPVVALVLAILYPFYQTKMFTIPVFGVWPDVATGVYMLVFVMMAVGLNIVVGYAGLLDLGYVAFYAMGAYTAAWFSSLQYRAQDVPLRRDRHRSEAARHPHHDLAAAPARRCAHGTRRDHHRAADAPPPRRLPRHRHARLR